MKFLHLWPLLLVLQGCASYPEASTSELYPYCEFADNSGQRVRMGYMDRAGQRVIGPEFESAYPFTDGLGCVQVKTDQGRRWGYIDSTGSWVIEPTYEKARPFREGRAWICAKRNKCGVIDKAGKAITDLDYDIGSSDYLDGRSFAYTYVGTQEGSKFSKTVMRVLTLGLAKGKGTKFYDVYEMDRNGQASLVLESTPKFDHSDSITSILQSNLTVFWTTNREGRRIYGYKKIWPGTILHQTLVEERNYVHAGEIVIPAQYMYAGRFYEGLARVNTAPGHGALIDTTGKVVLAFEDDLQRRR